MKSHKLVELALKYEQRCLVVERLVLQFLPLQFSFLQVYSPVFHSTLAHM
jgi:hypothetical protein